MSCEIFSSRFNVYSNLNLSPEYYQCWRGFQCYHLPDRFVHLLAVDYCWSETLIIFRNVSSIIYFREFIKHLSLDKVLTRKHLHSREPGSNFCFPILINLKNINFIQKSTQNALVVLFTAKPRAKQPNFLPEISRSYTMNITVILYQ